MKYYDRLFGSGPRGALIGTVIFVMVFLLEDVVSLPIITESNGFRYLVFAIFSVISVFIVAWNLL